MEEQFTVKGISSISTMNRAAYEKYQQALQSRRDIGRYTLEEAALYIHDATEERADEMQSKLMSAAFTGALPVYEPTKNARYKYGGEYASRTRNFYEEAYWNDLNEWLKNNEPRIHEFCKFPQPDASAARVEAVAARTIPERLMPDARNQFLINKPFELVFNPNKPLPSDLFNPAPGDLVPHKLDQWFLYDSWDIELACKLITIGYPVNLKGMAEEVEGWPLDCEGRDSFSAMVTVYSRALSIANSSVKAGTIKEHDTPAKWIEWAQGKGYSVAHLMPADAPGAKVEAEPVATHAPATMTNKLRRNSLDPAIDEAIKQAGSDELAAVYLKLKAMALNEEMPFTGALDGDALCYTDDNNQPARLTKDALSKRLKRRLTPLADGSRRA